MIRVKTFTGLAVLSQEGAAQEAQQKLDEYFNLNSNDLLVYNSPPSITATVNNDWYSVTIAVVINVYVPTPEDDNELPF